MISLLKSKSVNNGLWLYIHQLINLAIPLILLPYVSRVLGISSYGTFSKYINIITYLNVFVSYGFDLVGTRKVSILTDKIEINRLFTSVFLVKLFLFFVSLIFVFISLFIFNENRLIILILSSLLFSNLLQNLWLFQGLQRMKYIAIFNLIIKLIITGLIFVLVKSNRDLGLYTLLYVSNSLLTSILSFCIIFVVLKIEFTSLNFKFIKIEINDSFPTFLTSIGSAIYSGIAITVLTLFYEDDLIGGFNAVSKIPQLMIVAITPFLQAFFPFSSQKFRISFKNGLQSIYKISLIISLPIFAFLVGIILFSEDIVLLIFGSDFISYSTLLLPLTVWSIFSVLNNLMGIQILVSSGHQNLYSKGFYFGLLILLPSTYFLGRYYSAIGISIALLLSEIALSFLFLYFIIKLRWVNT